MALELEYFCVKCGRPAFTRYSVSASHWCRSCRYDHYEEYFGEGGINDQWLEYLDNEAKGQLMSWQLVVCRMCGTEQTPETRVWRKVITLQMCLPESEARFDGEYYYHPDHFPTLTPRPFEHLL